MPLLRVGSGPHAADIYYEVLGSDRRLIQERVLLIMGFAASHQAWQPQLEDLLQPRDDGTQPFEVCVFDNRGVGQSSTPVRKRAYTTRIMAADALALVDHLGWDRSHVVGHSMGGMIAQKMAAAQPQRIASLTLISVTGGGLQVLPRSWKAFKYALKGIRAKTPEDRATVDLKFHFKRQSLEEICTMHRQPRRVLLTEEYVANSGQQHPPDHADGTGGQALACLRHSVNRAEVAAIKAGAFPVLVIHGRHDIVATLKHGERIAHRLDAPCVVLDGAHFITRERGDEVNAAIRAMAFNGVEPAARSRHLATGRKLGLTAAASSPAELPSRREAAATAAWEQGYAPPSRQASAAAAARPSGGSAVRAGAAAAAARQEEAQRVDLDAAAEAVDAETPLMCDCGTCEEPPEASPGVLGKGPVSVAAAAALHPSDTSRAQSC